jgi:hypothetical protein
MTDLNTLTSANSPLYLLVAYDINSRGDIMGIALDESSGEPVAFTAVPCEQDGSNRCIDPALTAVGVERPKVVLPDSIRKRFRHPLGFGRLGFGLATSH